MIYEIIMSSPSKALCECRLQEWEKVWACKQADWDTEKKKTHPQRFTVVYIYS